MDGAGEEIDKEMKPNEHRGGLSEELERKIKSNPARDQTNGRANQAAGQID
jgi:hypothetical protein